MTELDEHSRELISKHLKFYGELDTGVRSPATEAQRRFVAVCRGETLPETEHEKAYMAYKELARTREQELSHGQDSMARSTPGYIKATAAKYLERKAIRERARSAAANEPETLSERYAAQLRTPISPDVNDDIPEYEEGFPTPTWYPGRDNSRLNPYGKNSYERDT